MQSPILLYIKKKDTKKKNLGRQESWVTRVGSNPEAKPRGFNPSTDPPLKIQPKTNKHDPCFSTRKTSLERRSKRYKRFLFPNPPWKLQRRTRKKEEKKQQKREKLLKIHCGLREPCNGKIQRETRFQTRV